MEPSYKIAGIDIHKKMLAVVVADARDTELKFEARRFGTTVGELHQLLGWLQELAVKEVAMESTAQYWKPVWLALEGQFRLHLAQARSNRSEARGLSVFGFVLARRLPGCPAVAPQ